MISRGEAVSLGISVGICVALHVIKRGLLSPSQRSHGSAAESAAAALPQDIEDELFSRVRTYFGRDGFSKLRGATVVVVGLGGVGSHAANMLVRSGVAHLRFIDFDQVTLSSLNRHALANMGDVGIPKAEAVRRRLLEVVPSSNMEAVVEMFVEGSAERLLLQNLPGGKAAPDYVLDCIDDVNTKAELLHFCHSRGLPVLTSMGAGGKSDPTKLRIGTLGDVVKDPLASKIKWKLKKKGILSSQIDDFMTVYSSEKPTVDLLPLSEEQFQNPHDFGAVDYLRLRVIPVLGTSPSIFGQAMASYVLCQVADRVYAPEACERMSRNLRQKVLKMLRKDETTRFGSDEAVDLDEDDCELVVQQIWGGRCAISGKRFGGHNSLSLTRWDPERGPAVDNLVLLAASEAGKLVKEGSGAFSPEQVAAVQTRLLWVRRTFLSDSTAAPAPLQLIDLEAASGSLVRRFLRAQLRLPDIMDVAQIATMAATSALVLHRML